MTTKKSSKVKTRSKGSRKAKPEIEVAVKPEVEKSKAVVAPSHFTPAKYVHRKDGYGKYAGDELGRNAETKNTMMDFVQESAVLLTPKDLLAKFPAKKVVRCLGSAVNKGYWGISGAVKNTTPGMKSADKVAAHISLGTEILNKFSNVGIAVLKNYKSRSQKA